MSYEDDATKAVRALFLETIPENGTASRRVRRWNVKHGFILTYLTWAAWLALVVIFIARLSSR